MDIEQIALLAGILFILIGVVGGGFTLKEISIPRVPAWARAVSMAIGLIFVGVFFYDRMTGAPRENGGNGELRVIHADDQPDRSRHGLRLTQLTARSDREAPRVDSLIAIEFALQNVSEEPITFSETFVAARSPSEENRDFGYSHQGLTLAPNETIRVKANLIVDAAGNWAFWPCYILADGGTDEENYCPARWRSFPVRVVE